jgi:hypothetical protein
VGNKLEPFHRADERAKRMPFVASRIAVNVREGAHLEKPFRARDLYDFAIYQAIAAGTPYTRALRMEFGGEGQFVVPEGWKAEIHAVFFGCSNDLTQPNLTPLARFEAPAHTRWAIKVREQFLWPYVDQVPALAWNVHAWVGATLVSMLWDGFFSHEYRYYMPVQVHLKPGDDFEIWHSTVNTGQNNIAPSQTNSFMSAWGWMIPETHEEDLVGGMWTP